jgi:hypothetical protein
MLEKIKQWGATALGIITLILGGLLMSQRRKTAQVESQLEGAKANTEIKLNDQAREAAAANADKLVDEYHKLRGDS